MGCDCAFFKLTYFPKKEKNGVLWLKCLLNVIIKHQLSFFGGVVRLPPYKNERHQLVTFTDGSDMYIHFKVLYIAVMLGIVQKEKKKIQTMSKKKKKKKKKKKS